MSTLFGSIYGLLYPAALLLTIPAVGLLMYAYLKKGQGVRHLVASTIILSQLQNRVAARRKFRPPPIFFLELLILLLMVIAISGLFKKDEQRSIALLIDNSLSMSASQADTSRVTLGATVLEEAINEARSYLGGMSSDSRIKILTTSPWLTPVSPRALSPADAAEALNDVKQAYGQDRLQYTIRQLFASGNYDQVAVFSDKRLTQSEKAQSTDALEKVSIFTVGTRTRQTAESRSNLQNIAILDSQIQLSPDSPDEFTVSATVAAFTTAPADVSVQLREYSQISTGADFLPVATIKETLQPEEPKNFVFRGVKTANPLQLQIVQNDRSDTETNRIPLDDHRWLIPNTTIAQPLLISDGTLDDLGLDQLQTESFQQMTPYQYEALAGAGDPLILNSPMMIFYKYSPRIYPPNNALFVLPPTNSVLFESSPAVTRAEVTRWLRSHPVTTYLNLPALSIPALQPLKTPAWANDLISTTRGSAAFLGEREGKKIVVLSFEIFPYEGGEAPVISILTLNILKWLREDVGDAYYMSLGSAIQDEGVNSATLYTGKEQLTLTTDTDSGKVTPQQPGFIQYITPQKEQRSIAVGFYDERESKILEPEFITISSLPRGEHVSSSNTESFGPLLAKLLVLLLLLHLLLLCIQSSSRPLKDGV